MSYRVVLVKSFVKPSQFDSERLSFEYSMPLELPFAPYSGLTIKLGTCNFTFAHVVYEYGLQYFRGYDDVEVPPNFDFDMCKREFLGNNCWREIA